MMAVSMKAEERPVNTRGSLKQLRRQGKVPGVVYGKNLEAPAAISVDGRALDALLRSHPHAVVDLELPGGGKQSVMLNEVQRDALSRQVMHIDLHQINMNEEVKTQVRIDVKGESPGVKEGGVLSVSLHEIEVQCLPGKIPDTVEADISALAIGENLHVSDLKLPEGVQAASDPALVILSVLAPQKELTEEEAEDQAVEQTEAEARSTEAAMEDTKNE